MLGAQAPPQDIFIFHKIMKIGRLVHFGPVDILCSRAVFSYHV